MAESDESLAGTSGLLGQPDARILEFCDARREIRRIMGKIETDHTLSGGFSIVASIALTQLQALLEDVESDTRTGKRSLAGAPH